MGPFDRSVQSDGSGGGFGTHRPLDGPGAGFGGGGGGAGCCTGTGGGGLLTGVGAAGPGMAHRFVLHLGIPKGDRVFFFLMLLFMSTFITIPALVFIIFKDMFLTFESMYTFLFKKLIHNVLSYPRFSRRPSILRLQVDSPRTSRVEEFVFQKKKEKPYSLPEKD